MDSQAGEIFAVATQPTEHGDCWIQSVIGLLDVATQQLQNRNEGAKSTIAQAASLLQEQMRARSRGRARAPAGLLTWQVHKIREYVDAHIEDRVRVFDLSAIVSLSEAHFSRSFKQTFGQSPHAFVLRRRLELAARLMLESTESLKSIAVRCGFTDQAHLCNRFRRSMGESPAAWRRARTQSPDAEDQCQSMFSEPRRVRRHVYGVSPTTRLKERVKCD